MRQYVWMTLFLLVVFLFSPVVPVPLSSYIFGVVSIFAVLLFFFSLELLRPKSRLSVASDHRSNAGKRVVMKPESTQRLRPAP